MEEKRPPDRRKEAEKGTAGGDAFAGLGKLAVVRVFGPRCHIKAARNQQTKVSQPPRTKLAIKLA